MNTQQKAILTIYNADVLSKDEIKRIRSWLSSISKNLSKEKYAKVCRFRLMNN